MHLENVLQVLSTIYNPCYGSLSPVYTSLAIFFNSLSPHIIILGMILHVNVKKPKTFNDGSFRARPAVTSVINSVHVSKSTGHHLFHKTLG